jgi:hypothetical protein
MDSHFHIDWLRRFRENLRTGDMEALSANAEAAGIDLLLDPALLALACELNFHPVVILIASLGEANAPDPLPYRRVLAAYQYLQGQITLDEAASACAQVSQCSPLFYADVLQSGKNQHPLRETGRHQVQADDARFAIEWLINIGNATAIGPLIKLWQQIDTTDKPWLVACRAVIKRTEVTHIQAEALTLALAAQLLIDTAPASQPSITQQVRVQRARLALKAQAADLACVAAAEALRYEDNGERHYSLARALALAGKISEATRHMHALLQDLLNKPNPSQDAETASATGFNVSNAEETLLTVNRLLRAKGLQPFLMSGTLLGYAREGGLLPHDKDIDIGLIGWQHQYAVAEALVEAGHFMFDMSQLKGQRRFLISALDMRNGNAVDFFLFHDHGDHFLHGIDFELGFTQNFRFSRFGLAEVDFLGDRFFVPDNIDRNLTENYGDWRTPASSYVVIVEAPAILHTNLEISDILVYQEVLRTLLKNMKPARIRRILAHLERTGRTVFDDSTRQRLVQWCERREVTQEQHIAEAMASV